jgi:hypothetical protein
MQAAAVKCPVADPAHERGTVMRIAGSREPRRVQQRVTGWLVDPAPSHDRTAPVGEVDRHHRPVVCRAR